MTRKSQQNKLQTGRHSVSDLESVGRPRTREAKPGEAMHLSMTIDGAVVKALDEEAERMGVERPGLKFTRTDVIRVLLHDWMTSRTKRGK